jgi:hypothetical protein
MEKGTKIKWSSDFYFANCTESNTTSPLVVSERELQLNKDLTSLVKSNRIILASEAELGEGDLGDVFDEPSQHTKNFTVSGMKE